MGFILCMNCGGMYVENEQNATECIGCHSSNVTKIPEEYNLRGNDYLDIIRIKKEPDFILSMIELKHENPVEYELKMRQFKALEEEKNKPKCPTCGSTKIKKVSATSKAVSVGLFGLFSQKVKKTWHCNSCGYEW